MLTIGQIAPDFTLQDQNNNPTSLSDFIGEKIVIWFYPKASTPGWTVEGEGFRDEFKKFQDNNIHIIGVSADSPKKNKKFSDKHGFLYPLLSDENHNMLKDYGVWGPKKFMGKEYIGISRMTYLIDEKGKIKLVFDKVKTKTHALDILNHL